MTPDPAGREVVVLLERTQTSSPGPSQEAVDVQIRHRFLELFENALSFARGLAVSIGVLQAVSRHVGFAMSCHALCSLSLASSSTLSSNLVTLLLCLSVVSAHVSLPPAGILCTLWGNQASQRLKHRTGKFHHVSGCGRIVSHAVPLIFSIASLSLLDLNTCAYLGYCRHDLRPSVLYYFLLFYIILVILNFILSLLAYVFLYKHPVKNYTVRALANASLHKCPARDMYSQHTVPTADERAQQSSIPACDNHLQQSTLIYFDTVLENVRTLGLVRAGDLDIFGFAYTMLGAEIRSFAQFEIVVKNHKNLIRYLYYHRLGVNALQIFMEDEDPFVQLAAVSIVHWWADSAWGVGLQESELKLPRNLLMKLADKVGKRGPLESAAISSIQALACSTPEWCKKLWKLKNSNGQLLPDCLVDSIDMYGSKCTLSILTTLVQLCEHGRGCSISTDQEEPLFISKNRCEVINKLLFLVEKAERQQLGARAADLLRLLQADSCRVQDLTRSFLL